MCRKIRCDGESENFWILGGSKHGLTRTFVFSLVINLSYTEYYFQLAGRPSLIAQLFINNIYKYVYVLLHYSGFYHRIVSFTIVMLHQLPPFPHCAFHYRILMPVPVTLSYIFQDLYFLCRKMLNLIVEFKFCAKIFDILASQCTFLFF